MELLKFQKDNLFQRLKAHYINDDVVLSDVEIEKKNLYEKIWALRFENKYSKLDIISICMRPTERGGLNIPRSTAYRSYNYAMQLYGDIDAVDHAAEISFLKVAFHEEYTLAKKNGDRKNAIAALKEYRTLIPQKDSGPEIDPKKLEASIYRQVLPVEVKKMFRKAMEGGVFDFMNLNADFAEFQEVKDDEIEDEEGDE